jgi:hypothetical protein
MAPRRGAQQRAANDEPENAYEAKRAEIMARNKQKMQQLGVVQAIADLQATMAAAAGRPRAAPKRPREPQVRRTDRPAMKGCRSAPLPLWHLDIHRAVGPLSPPARSPANAPPLPAPAQEALPRRLSSRIQNQGVSYAGACEEGGGSVFRRRGKLGVSRIPLTKTDVKFEAPFFLRFTGARRL